MQDRFALHRFIEAQAPVQAHVQAELHQGRKTSHWMWFVFPQIAGLGSSPMAQRYAISSIDEARAYLADPVLGPRLVEATKTVNAHQTKTAHAIFGSPDDLKFRSCMTLFAAADPAEACFRTALDLFYDGQGDPNTLARIGPQH